MSITKNDYERLYEVENTNGNAEDGDEGSDEENDKASGSTHRLTVSDSPTHSLINLLTRRGSIWAAGCGADHKNQVSDANSPEIRVCIPKYSGVLGPSGAGGLGTGAA